MSYNQYAEIEQKLRNASPEQRAAYITHLEQVLDRNQKNYDQAVRHRPSYAPPGRETRNESGTRLVLKQTTDLLNHVLDFCAKL